MLYMLNLITLDVFKEEVLEGLDVRLADAHFVNEVLGDGLLELVVGIICKGGIVALSLEIVHTVRVCSGSSDAVTASDAVGKTRQFKVDGAILGGYAEEALDDQSPVTGAVRTDIAVEVGCLAALGAIDESHHRFIYPVRIGQRTARGTTDACAISGTAIDDVSVRIHGVRIHDHRIAGIQERIVTAGAGSSSAVDIATVTEVVIQTDIHELSKQFLLGSRCAGKIGAAVDHAVFDSFLAILGDHTAEVTAVIGVVLAYRVADFEHTAPAFRIEGGLVQIIAVCIIHDRTIVGPTGNQIIDIERSAATGRAPGPDLVGQRLVVIDRDGCRSGACRSPIQADGVGNVHTGGSSGRTTLSGVVTTVGGGRSIICDMRL